MVMIKDNKGKEQYSIPQKIYDLLQRVKTKINHEDQEFWIAFGGDTGTGKSLMSMRWAFVVDPKLSNDKVCFDKTEFVDAVLQAKKGEAIICDESISILFSRQAMTKEGRLVAQLINQIRQKNLLICLNIPDVLTLDYTALSKLNVYIHVWESRYKKGNRLVTFKGNAAVFPELPSSPYRTRIIDYLKKKRRNPLYTFKRPRPFCTIKGNPMGESFKKPWYPIDEARYRKRKEDILVKYRPGKAIGDIHKERTDKFIHDLHIKFKMTEREIAKDYNMKKTTVHRAIHREKAKISKEKGFGPVLDAI